MTELKARVTRESERLMGETRKGASIETEETLKAMGRSVLRRRVDVADEPQRRAPEDRAHRFGHLPRR